MQLRCSWLRNASLAWFVDCYCLKLKLEKALCCVGNTLFANCFQLQMKATLLSRLLVGSTPAMRALQRVDASIRLAGPSGSL